MKKLLILTLLMLLSINCKDSTTTSVSDTDITPITSVTLSGVVIDPEVQGASIKLIHTRDTSKRLEGTTTTDSLGRYSLTTNIPEGDSLENYSLVIENGFDRVSGEPIEFKMKRSLKDAPDQTDLVISPITTLIENEVAKGRRVDSAKMIVKQTLNIDTAYMNTNFVKDTNRKTEIKAAFMIVSLTKELKNDKKKEGLAAIHNIIDSARQDADLNQGLEYILNDTNRVKKLMDKFTDAGIIEDTRKYEIAHHVHQIKKQVLDARESKGHKDLKKATLHIHIRKTLQKKLLQKLNSLPLTDGDYRIFDRGLDAIINVMVQSIDKVKSANSIDSIVTTLIDRKIPTDTSGPAFFTELKEIGKAEFIPSASIKNFFSEDLTRKIKIESESNQDTRVFERDTIHINIPFDTATRKPIFEREPQR